MRRHSWAWSGAGLAVFAAFGAWAWFLAGKTLDVADRWSSVLSSFAALAGLVVAVLALVLGRGRASATPVGERGVAIGGDAPDATIITGDRSSSQR